MDVACDSPDVVLGNSLSVFYEQSHVIVEGGVEADEHVQQKNNIEAQVELAMPVPGAVGADEYDVEWDLRMSASAFWRGRTIESGSCNDSFGTSNVLYIKIIRSNKSQEILHFEYGAKMIRFQNERRDLMRLTKSRKQKSRC
jgi:hypothetical protein